MIGSPRFQKAVERNKRILPSTKKEGKNSKYSNINGDKVNSNPEQLLKYLDIKKKKKAIFSYWQRSSTQNWFICEFNSVSNIASEDLNWKMVISSVMVPFLVGKSLVCKGISDRIQAAPHTLTREHNKSVRAIKSRCEIWNENPMHRCHKQVW